MFSPQHDPVVINPNAGWTFKFVRRSFRTVLLVEKDNISRGFLHLDSDEEIEYWKQLVMPVKDEQT